MAGGNRWYTYTADNGNNYAIFADTSNTDAVNAGTNPYATGTGIFKLPRNVKPRYVVYGDLNGKRKIKCYCLTPTVYQGIAGGAVPTITDPIDQSTTMNLVLVEQEKIRRLPRVDDTGLTGDGTGV